MKLYVMQGIPGSGKSTLAQSMANLKDGVIFSTDNFWGEDYNYIPEKVGVAHRWNQANVERAMIAKTPVIIVDNTNVTKEAVEPYVNLAREYGYNLEFVRMDTPLEECLKRNAARPENRRIPEDVVRKMHAQLGSWT